jgi:hypothetical protein
MTAVIGNTPYAIADWSMGGVCILDYFGNLGEGDVTNLRMLVPTAGPGALFHARGEVRRKQDDDGVLGLCFQELDTIAFGTLSRYLRERLIRGQA